MRQGRWFGYSVRQIHRAITGAASEATLRRWATDAEDITTAVLVDVDERDATAFATVFAAAAGHDMHKGTSRALAEHLLRLAPLPPARGWITLTHTPTTGITCTWQATTSDLATYLERAREAVTVIPTPPRPTTTRTREQVNE